MNLTSVLHLNPIYTHQPVAFIVTQFLKKQRIKINTGLLHQKLSEHPYFPSLLSISDVLTALNVSNQAYKIGLETLKENFETSVLTYLNINQGLFCILEKIKDGNFKVITEKGEKKWLGEEEFMNMWEGVLLDVEGADRTQYSVPASYPAYLKYFMAVCWAFITFYILQNQLSALTLSRVVMLVLHVSGLFISWLLVLQHFNKNNVLVQQLCESKTHEGCSTVLNNKTAQLTPWFSMAEAGFVYFAGFTLVLLVFNKYSSIYLLSLMAPLFSLYAIYHQAFVIKQWCRLCMAVHAVVFLSFAASVYIHWNKPLAYPPAEEIICFLLPGLIWLFVKPYITQLKDTKQHHSEYARLKYNPEIFLALITKQPKINIPESLRVFTLGNREAEHELTFVSNPFCGPCTQAHSVIEEWLNQELDFRINIIFIHTADKNDNKRVFAEHIAGITDQERMKEILHGWFSASGTKDIRQWAEQYQLQKKALSYNKEDLQQWLKIADVTATPTFFINGYRLPNAYRISDIRYLINEVPLHNRSTGFPILQTNLYDL